MTWHELANVFFSPPCTRSVSESFYPDERVPAVSYQHTVTPTLYKDTCLVYHEESPKVKREAEPEELNRKICSQKEKKSLKIFTTMETEIIIGQ